MDSVYYDIDEFEKIFSSTSFIWQNAKPIPAGISIFSMPDTEKNKKWKSFADMYDIRFIFDDNIPEVDFYAVPQFHIMATDSNGGLIGIVGGKDSLNTHLPIAYVSANREVFIVSSSGHSFIENIKQWKKHLEPYDKLKLFDSKEAAKREKPFLDIEQVKTEMERITSE